MFTQVRIKGIVNDLADQTKPLMLPTPLLLFLNGMTTQGTFIPDNWLTPYQLNRIDIDNYGAIIDLDDMQVKMIAGTFLFVRILIFDVLMGNANKNTPQLVQDNMKFVCSILYYLFVRQLNSKMKDYKRAKDTKGNDIFSELLYEYTTVE